MSGIPKDTEAYRSELAGILHSVSIIETIFKKHSLNEVLITAACDGLEAIREAIDQEKTSHVSQIVSTYYQP